MPIRHSHPGVIAALWTGDLVLLLMLWPTPFTLGSVGAVLVMWLVPTIPLALATAPWRHPHPKHASIKAEKPLGHRLAWAAVFLLALMGTAFGLFLGRLDPTPRFGAIATVVIVVVVGYGLYSLLDNVSRWR